MHAYPCLWNLCLVPVFSQPLSIPLKRYLSTLSLLLFYHNNSTPNPEHRPLHPTLTKPSSFPLDPAALPFRPTTIGRSLWFGIHLRPGRDDALRSINYPNAAKYMPNLRHTRARLHIKTFNDPLFFYMSLLVTTI